MNLQEIRQQYPQYNDLSDQDLATGLHKKFYSDLPFEDFSKRIGLKAEVPTPTAPIQVAPIISPEETTATTASGEPPSAIWDIPKKITAGLVQSTAEAPLGAETAVRALPRQVATGEILEQSPWYRLFQAATGTIPTKEQQQEIVNRRVAIDTAIDENVPRIPGLKPLAEKGEQIAKDLRESLSPEALEALRGSEIKGNLLEAIKNRDFSKLSFGEDPSLYGYALHMSDVLGSLAPVIATAIITKSPAATGGVGGSMAAGEAVNTATEYIKGKSDIELAAASPYYKDLRSTGMSEEQARRIITDRAAEQAALLQGTVAMLGGIATERIISGALDKYITKSGVGRLRSIAQGTAVGALEEGTQEFLEGIASDLGINKEVVKEIGEDSFANLVLGAMGGAPVGAGRGAVAKPEQTKLDKEIADIERQLDKAAATEEQKKDSIRNAFDTGFEKMYGRKATDDELDQMVETYEQRKLAETAAEPDAAGRVEPSISVPGAPTTEAGVTGEPARVEPSGVGIPGVPTDITGIGAAQQPSPLGQLFQPSDTVSAQQKRTNIHYNTLMTQPENPVTQSLNALDASIQKAKDAYADIAARLNIPSGEDMMGLGVRLPTPIGDLLKYPSASGSAMRLVNASKDVASGAKRGSQAKVDSALKQVQGEVSSVDKIIADALAAAEDPAVQARIDKLNEQLAVNKGVAARQAEITAVPMEQRAAKIKEIEDEIRAGLKAKVAPIPAEVTAPEAKKVEPTLPKNVAEDLALDEEIKAIDAVTPDSDTVQGIPVEDKAAEVQHMDDNAKKTAQDILDDFMVGDAVRYGNMPGNIVGLDGDYVRFRPLKATSPKAYIRVPKSKVTFESRPTGGYKAATSSAGDKKFTERQGQLNADTDNILEILGGSMYGSGISDVAVKELLQNAFDTVKEAVYNKIMKVGHIEIILNEQDRTITIKDDGMGMTSDIVDQAFFTVAGSEKNVPPELSSGGYGFAKVAFMTSTESISLDTVRDGVRNTTSASAKDIRKSQFKIKTTPAPKKEHGTTVVVKIPESYIDKKGEPRNIWFTSNPDNISALTKPIVGPVEVKVTSISSRGASKTITLNTGIYFDYAAMPLLTKVNFDWGSADIYYSVNRSDDPKNPNHYILSSGVYQFKGDGGDYGRFMLNQQEPIPFDIVVDVKSKVKPKDANYPFTISREAFRPSHKADVKALVAYLQQVARGIEAEGMQESFKNIVSMPRVDVGADLAETAGKLKKAFDKRRDEGKKFELPPMPKEVQVSGTQVLDLKGTVLVDSKPESERKIEGSFQAEKEAPKMEQFLLQMDQDPKKPVFHNNTNVDYLEAGRPYGNPEQFFAELGSLFVEMKEAIANSGMYGYSQLEDKNLWFTGISIDKKYGGVNILVPYKANYLNPFYEWGARSLFGVRENLLNTMIHEIAHVADREHGVGHNNEMLRIQQYLADEGLMDYYRDALLDVLARHESTFTAMREAYGRSTTKNTAKSLEDYEGSTASVSTRGVVSGGEYTSPAVSAGERSRGGGDIRSVGPNDPAGKFDGGVDKLLAILEKPSIIKGPVLEALVNNDITGALRAISAQTKGFYGDLAARLADLNLPTTIVLNNVRALIRRQITEKVGFSEHRLFDYIQRTYPTLHKQYFENYDRQENLDKVFEGLKAIKDKYDMKPVISEYEATLNEYNKNMQGIVVPGAYFPMFDAISLDTENATYDVFLHEVVHAATEAILNADPSTLTPGQREAIEALEDMFEYAKAQIPVRLYGFTDIHEFVSELFTNKAFREKLQKIQYKPAKQPLMTQIARAIYKLFGIDNLAGNAMAQATQLFSAVRTKKPISIGPRFVGQPKKDPKKGPATGNWRAQEDYGTNVLGMIQQMNKDGVPWSKISKDVGKALFRAKYSGLRRLILPALGLRHLSDITKWAFPQLQGAVRTVEKMLADRNRHMTEGAEILRDWLKLQRKNANMERLMSRVMVEATIRGVDPATASATDLPPTDPLARAWAMLPAEYKAMYKKVQYYYINMLRETLNVMKQRVRDSSKPLAEQQDLIDEIDRQFGINKLVHPYFPLRRFGKFWFQVGQRNFKEFVEFESESARNLAMERTRERLIRNGRKDLAATIEAGNGMSELYSRNMASTKIFQDMQQIVDKISASSVTDAKDQIKDALDQLLYIMLPQNSMRKMFINRQGIQGASADMLRVFATTSVHSAYQLSRFKYAEEFRANLTGAIDYVRDKYKGSLTGAAYRDFIQEVESRDKQIMSNEDTSVAAVLSGKASQAAYFYMLTAPVTALVNLLGFPQLVLSTLGGDYGFRKTGRIATGHMLQYLRSSGSRTIVPLAKGQFLQAKFPSLFESGYLNPELQRAADVFIEENDVNISQTSDIMGLSDRPSELYTGRWDTTKRVISEPFHQSERLMREIGLITAFELAYEKLSAEPKRTQEGYIMRDAAGNPVMRTPQESFDDAIQEARDKIGLTLGDFNRPMKPRYLAMPGVSVLMIFKTFAIYATYAVLRNSQVTMFGPLSKSERNEIQQKLTEQLATDPNRDQLIAQRMKEIDEYLSVNKKESLRRMAGIMGTSFLLGGLAATPFFSVLMPIIANMFGDADDDEFFDWEAWFRNWCQETLGGYAANLLKDMGASEKTAEKYGKDIGMSVARGPVGTFAGVSLSDRVSLDLKNLWIRDPRYTPDARQEVIESAVANAGPFAGLILNHVDAYKLFNEGHYHRAFEKATPAFISKPLTAERMAREGAQTKQGIPQIAEFSSFEIAMQAIGLQPERLALLQKKSIAEKQYEQKILAKRDAIMDRLWLEYRTDNNEGYERAMEARDKFNDMYPERRITQKNIRESFEKRRKDASAAEDFGTNIDKKLRGRIEEKFGPMSKE